MLYDKNISFSKFYLIFFLIIFSLKIFNCQEELDYSISKCYKQIVSLEEEQCFNNYLTFENYQVNHFAKNKNGDFVVKFTEYRKNNEKSLSRIFFGLPNENGYFFSNGSSTRKFKIDIDKKIYNENNNFAFNSSKNLFVFIKDADNIKNKYLFSINSYNSLVELYDLNDKDIKYHIYNFNQFFNLNEGEYLSSFNYEIFGLTQESTYIIAFIPKKKVDLEMSSKTFIKKFKFKSFDDDTCEEVHSIDFTDFENKKILSVFLMDDKDIIVVLASNKNDGRRRNSKIIPPGDWLSLRRTDNYRFFLTFYSNKIDKLNDMEINDEDLSEWYYGEGLFIKSLYLNNKFAVFIYFKESRDFFYIKLFELNYNDLTNSNLIVKDLTIDIYYNFDMDESLNDFIKINNNRLAFIYSNSSHGCIIIININEITKDISYNDYYNQTFITLLIFMILNQLFRYQDFHIMVICYLLLLLSQIIIILNIILMKIYLTIYQCL